MEKYIFREYDPKYRDFFLKERGKLEKLLDSGVKIEHVGSTAIEGLGGKGLVDILVGISDIKKAGQKLEKAGYRPGKNGSTPERLVFAHDYTYKGEERMVHVHVTKFNSRDWKEIIGFRNYLMCHPKTVEKYVKTKKESVKKAKGDGAIYRKNKESFIRNVLKKALQ